MEMVKANVGWAIQTMRRFRKITQQEMALRCGLRENKITRIETGRAIPSKNELLGIAKALKTSVKTLTNMTHDNPPPLRGGVGRQPRPSKKNAERKKT